MNFLILLKEEILELEASISSSMLSPLLSVTCRRQRDTAYFYHVHVFKPFDTISNRYHFRLIPSTLRAQSPGCKSSLTVKAMITAVLESLSDVDVCLNFPRTFLNLACYPSIITNSNSFHSQKYSGLDDVLYDHPMRRPR